MLGLACNEFTKEMTLDISNCGLGSQGAHVLESCVHGVRCISSLDISENSKYISKINNEESIIAEDFQLSSVVTRPVIKKKPLCLTNLLLCFNRVIINIEVK